MDRYLDDFVVWCQKRYPCQLYSETAKPVPPEDLLSEFVMSFLTMNLMLNLKFKQCQ